MPCEGVLDRQACHVKECMMGKHAEGQVGKHAHRSGKHATWWRAGG